MHDANIPYRRRGPVRRRPGSREGRSRARADRRARRRARGRQRRLRPLDRWPAHGTGREHGGVRSAGARDDAQERRLRPAARRRQVRAARRPPHGGRAQAMPRSYLRARASPRDRLHLRPGHGDRRDLHGVGEGRDRSRRGAAARPGRAGRDRRHRMGAPACGRGRGVALRPRAPRGARRDPGVRRGGQAQRPLSRGLRRGADRSLRFQGRGPPRRGHRRRAADRAQGGRSERRRL